jgi:hypothetical protein
MLYRTRSQIALFQKVESAICDRGYYINLNWRMNEYMKIWDEALASPQIGYDMIQSA